jgi:hypothetical protein
LRGFVIGNGESRKGFDLQSLRPFGLIYGCNALYRDFTPDVLVSVDDAMIKEVLENSPNCEFVYRVFEDGRNHCLKSTESDRVIHDKGYASGQTAIKLMCDRFFDKGLTEVFMIGFDLISTTDRINNVYKGTNCYKPIDTGPTFNKNWIRRCTAIFRENEHVKFYRVFTDQSSVISEWFGIDNIHYITYNHLKQLMSDWEVKGC